MTRYRQPRHTDGKNRTDDKTNTDLLYPEACGDDLTQIGKVKNPKPYNKEAPEGILKTARWKD